jgi:biopolymer transport protein ExbD
MQVLKRLSRTSVGINMTPMIDVVFLLIIFFLVSSHLAQRETRIQVELPSAARGQFDRPDASPRITITLQEDGRVWLGSRPLSTEQLSERLRSELQQHGQRLELRIRCDRRLPYRQVEPVLAGAARAGLWNVSFAVLERSEGSP